MERPNLILLQKLMDFTVWTSGHTIQFPKSYRYSYAVKFENLLLETILLVQKAAHSKEPQKLLISIDNNIEGLRILFRLCFELKFINIKSFEFASKSIDEIGKIFGGFQKSKVKI